MKRMTVLCLLIACGFVRAEPLDTRMIAVNAQYVRATADQMKEANPQELAILSAPQLDEVVAALKKGGAEFLSNPRSVVLNGQRTEVKAARELRFPDGFADPAKTKGKAMPESFETRDIGTLFAFEAVLATDESVKLSVQADFTKFLGFIDYSTEKKPAAAGKSLDQLARESLTEGTAWQPLISTFQVKTDVALRSGQTALLGGTEPNPPPRDGPEAGRLIYVFVTARVIPEK